MPLYYITGIAGAGKSTILSELRKLGFEAYDVDEAGPVTAKWHHNTTGFVHPKSSVKAEDRTPTFLAEHSWKVPRQEVVDLAKRAHDKAIFVGGSIANEPEIIDLFTATFALAIDDVTLTERLKSRTNNDWGKSKHELEHTLAANHGLHESYKRLGYYVIDATQAASIVTSKILSTIHDNQ